MKTLDQKMKGIGTARRKKIEARAAALIAEEMTLHEPPAGSQTRQSVDGESSRIRQNATRVQ